MSGVKLIEAELLLYVSVDKPSWVQIMACPLDGAKPLSEHMLAYCHLDSWEQFRWNLNRNSLMLMKTNAFENVVCQYGGHFVQRGWVKAAPHRRDWMLLMPTR